MDAMLVTINLYATFRLIAGVKTIPLELPEGTTVARVMQTIVKQVPALRPHWYDAQGELFPHVHAILNGEDVTTLPEQWQTAIKQDAVLDFFPPVAGG